MSTPTVNFRTSKKLNSDQYALALIRWCKRNKVSLSQIFNLVTVALAEKLLPYDYEDIAGEINITIMLPESSKNKP